MEFVVQWYQILGQEINFGLATHLIFQIARVLVPTKMPIHSTTIKYIGKILGSILIVLILVFGPVGCFFISISRGMCGNEIYQEVYSPDNEYKVIVFERNCGATTAYSTRVSIIKASAELPNKSGNIFVMDGHPDWTDVKVDSTEKTSGQI